MASRAHGQPPSGLVVRRPENPADGIDIPLYDQDGVTVIGTFTVSPGRVVLSSVRSSALCTGSGGRS